MAGRFELELRAGLITPCRKGMVWGLLGTHDRKLVLPKKTIVGGHRIAEKGRGSAVFEKNPLEGEQGGGEQKSVGSKQ